MYVLPVGSNTTPNTTGDFLTPVVQFTSLGALEKYVFCMLSCDRTHPSTPRKRVTANFINNDILRNWPMAASAARRLAA
ncbi:MAG: hypothetical protein AAF228_13930 [Pseudomonadota bacterium]